MYKCNKCSNNGKKNKKEIVYSSLSVVFIMKIGNMGLWTVFFLEFRLCYFLWQQLILFDHILGRDK